MRIERVRIHTHKGAMPATGNARSMWTERTSVLVDLVDERKNVGRGEASPLPGYSPESIEDARAALAALALDDVEIDETAAPLVEVRHLTARLSAAFPSARFALETALLELLAKRLERPLWSLLSEDGIARPAPVAALVDTAPELARSESARIEAALARAEQAHARGIRTLKLKIGAPGARRTELATLRALRARFGDEMRLRVDANQALDEDELYETLGALAREHVTLVEEPAPFSVAIRCEVPPVPFALDESLIGPEGDVRLSLACERGLLGAVVLKPTVLGGLLRARDLARHARARGVGAIVSHTFDGPRAWAAAAALAVALPEPRRAAGLDFHAGLAAFPPHVLPALEHGCVRPSDEPGLGLAAGC